ncbi:MAG: histidinol phosphate phosphatase domain-containing protein [Pseudomonadota bacterium]
MIDLHTHTIFSDGELLPAELCRRLEVLGYSAVALTDHADPSNLDWMVPRIVHAAQELNAHMGIQLVPGVELTHLPPILIAESAARARQLGALVVVVHGETIVEPVPPGTNHAALLCPDVDVLAHPGMLSLEDAQLAAERGVALEITSRGGHSLTNGHVARLAQQTGAPLVLNSDAHAPKDLVPPGFADLVGRAAGLTEAQVAKARRNAQELLDRARSIQTRQAPPQA